MPKVTVIALPDDTVARPNETRQTFQESRKAQWFGRFRSWLAELLYRDNLPINLMGFMLGRVVLMGEFAPFGLAFFVVVGQLAPLRTTTLSVWLLAGVLSTGQYQEVGLYAAAIVAYFRWRDTVLKRHRHSFALPLLFACVLAVGGIIIAWWGQGGLYSILLTVFDILIFLVSSRVFLYVIPWLIAVVEGKTGRITPEQIICIAAMFAVTVAAMGNLTVLEYSLRSIAGNILAMMAAMMAGPGGGAAIGIAIGIAASLIDGDVYKMAAFLAVAGMLAGAFRSFGKLGVVLGYILGSIIVISFAGQAGTSLISLTEAGLAAAIFAILPTKRLMAAMGNPVREGENKDYSKERKAAEKIVHIADVFADLARVFETISNDEVKKIKTGEMSGLLNSVGEQVCGECHQQSRCWDADFFRAYQAVVDALAQAESQRISIARLPDYLKEHCSRQREFVDAVNSVIEKNRVLINWQKRMVDQQNVTGEQLKAISAIINDLASEIVREPDSDKELAKVIGNRAALLECPVENVRVSMEKSRVKKVELSKCACSGGRECANTILPLVSGILGEKLTIDAECGDLARFKQCRVEMSATERFKVITAGAGIAKEQGINGDTCSVITLQKGKIALILSDGMGSGPKAAGESVMAVRFIEKLLNIGFEIDATLKVVNSLLLLRVADESFATVDMAVIDLYSGEAEFLKIGSAPSFVKRVREVTTVRAMSAPIGILQQIEIERVRVNLAVGDVVVLISDGVVDAPGQRITDKESWLANCLRRVDDKDPQTVAEKLLTEACRMRGGQAQDDMTVLVAKLVERPILLQ